MKTKPGKMAPSMRSGRSDKAVLCRLAMLVALAVLIGCSHQGDRLTPTAATMEERWGVTPVALRLIGGDHFIDFRYRIIDADKAKALLSRNHQPYLIDEASGKVHTVPLTKLGPMRASAVKPKANRNYVVLFGNSQKIIERGSLVTVVIGDFRAEHMKVM